MTSGANDSKIDLSDNKERWETVEALQAHFQTPHMTEFQAAMAERPPASIDVKFYKVEDFNPF